jgi:uncharacterized protein
MVIVPWLLLNLVFMIHSGGIASIFAGPTLERIDARQDYGEVRRIALGVADGIPLTVVYTDRAEAGEVVRRIISARVSSRRERQAYRKIFPS